jgi:4-hydroxybenzoate polyprenyltransferase
VSVAEGIAGLVLAAVIAARRGLWARRRRGRPLADGVLQWFERATMVAMLLVTTFLAAFFLQAFTRVVALRVIGGSALTVGAFAAGFAVQPRLARTS